MLPSSTFKSRLTVARAGTHGRRYTLLNREFKIRERDGHASVRTIGSAPELLEVLAEHFELCFPEANRFGEAPDSPWPT